MKTNSTNLILSIFVLAALSNTSSLAQNAKTPKWLHAEMNINEAVAKGSSRSEAYRMALTELLQKSTTLPNDSAPCLYNTLTKRNIPFDPMPSIIEAGMQSSHFSIADVYQPIDEDSVYVYTKITAASLQAFQDSLVDAAFGAGVDHLIEARQYIEEGDLYAAAKAYCNAIQTVTPCMYYELPTDENDLGELLLNEYSTLFNGITMSFDHTEFPMVQGEEVPGQILLSVQKKESILKNFPVKIWMRQHDAKLKVDTLTDAEGQAKIHLSQAPKTERANVIAAIDIDVIKSLPANYATPLLNRQLRDSVRQFSMPFVSFEPVTYYRLDTDAADTIAANLTLAQMLELKEVGFLPAVNPLTADISITMDYAAKTGTPVKAGSYKIREDSCSITIRVRDIYHDKEIFKHVIDGFAVKVPETRSSDKVRSLAVKEMIKRIFIQQPNLFKSVPFDKRKIVYERAQ